MVQIAKSLTYGKKVQYTYISHTLRSQAGCVAYIVYTLQTRLVRTLRVNCTTTQTVSPYTAWCIVYIRSLFMSSFRFSIHFWYLRLFYSDGFPYFIAPAFSTPAFSTPAIYSHIFHSCIFHSRIFSAPLLRVMFR